MSEIKAEYDFTYPLFLEANRLHRSRSLRVSTIFWLLFVGFPVLTLALGIKAFVESQEAGEKSPLWSLVWILAFYSVFLWALRYFSSRRTYKNSFPKRLTSRLVVLAVSEAGVHILTSGEVETNLSWPSLCRFVHNESLAIFYYSKTRFIPIPKHSLASHQWDELISLSAQKLGASKC